MEAGRWENPSEISALVRSPSGYYVNTLPRADRPQAELLLAMLGDLEPARWAEALEGVRNRPARAVAEAGVRWAEVRVQPELTREARERIEVELAAQRERVPPDAIPPPEVEANRAVLAARVQQGLRVEDDVRRLCCQMAASRKGEVRGIRISADGPTDWDEVMRRVRDAGLNTVFVRARGPGSAASPAANPPADAAPAAGADALKLATEAAHRYGLQCHAWRVSFSLDAAPPKSSPTGWRLMTGWSGDPEGKQGRFLNPGDPRNQEEELSALLELARSYDLDGIQLNSISYPDAPHYDWDYGPVSRREYEKASSRPVERWPEDVLSGSRKQDYEEWERETINRFVQRVYADVKKVKPYLQVSAAVRRDHRHGRAAVKQDWPLWAQSGWVDLVMTTGPALELDALAWVLEAQVSITRGKAVLVAGLGGERSSSTRWTSSGRSRRRAPRGRTGSSSYPMNPPASMKRLRRFGPEPPPERPGRPSWLPGRNGPWPEPSTGRDAPGICGRRPGPGGHQAAQPLPVRAPLKAVEGIVRLEDTAAPALHRYCDHGGGVEERPLRGPGPASSAP